MSIWKRKYRVLNNDVNMYQDMRTSRLMELLQQACISHTEELGMGREKTLDKGILWVVLQQAVRIQRMPVYDEEIIIECWPGDTMHVLFPRYFDILDTEGNIMLEGSCLWTLIDADTRKMVFADRYGIEIPGDSSKQSIDLPEPIRRMETDQKRSFTVPFSYCDLNGHMNNTKYFDLAEDTIRAIAGGKKLSSITTEYASEVRYQQTMEISWKEDHTFCYLSGDTDKNCFRIQMTFD